jgi:hypothetical protein
MAAYIGLLVLVAFARFLYIPSSDAQIVTIEMTRFLICIASGLLLARFVTTRLQTSPRERAVRRASSAFRLGVALVALAYLVTWAFGVPSVQSALENEAWQTWKRLEARNHAPELQIYPFIRTYLAFPPLPFLVVTYHEYQVAGLHGWGGWQLHVWIPGHLRSLGSKWAWIS